VKFYDKHPPFEIIFDPNLHQIGNTNYDRNTANLGMTIAVKPSQASFAALNTLIEGLEKTGRREIWGFSGWPLLDTHKDRSIRETIVFNSRRTFTYKIDVAIINEQNKILGKGSATMTTNLIDFYAGDKNIELPENVVEIINFSNIRASDLTKTLTIEIISVNGVPASKINETGFLRIDTGDLSILYNQKLREIERAKEEKAKEKENHFSNDLHLKYFVEGGYTLGTNSGLINAVGLGWGYMNFFGSFGLFFYPGLNEKKINEYIQNKVYEKDQDGFTTIGSNFGLLYSFLLYPKWHLSLGSGLTIFTFSFSYPIEDSNNNISSDEVKYKKISAYIPNAQVWFNYRLRKLNGGGIYLKAGYRCDFYPDNYSAFFSKPEIKSNKVFSGHSLMLGIDLIGFL